MKAAALAGLLALVASSASAQPAPSADPVEAGPVWEMHPQIDLPVVAVELAVGSAWLLGPQLPPPHCAPVCDRNDVWAIDRFAAGWWRPGWGVAGDLGVVVTFLTAAGTLWADEGLLPALSDVVIVAEAVAGSIALANLTNMSSGRPRPHVYGTASPVEDRMSGKAAFSFPSGHTAGAFAATIATFLTLRERHPNAAGPWIALGVGLGMSTFVGFARLYSGNHFLTDTLMGAVIGTGLGFAVPALHDSQMRVGASASDDHAAITLTGIL